MPPHQTLFWIILQLILVNWRCFCQWKKILSTTHTHTHKKVRVTFLSHYLYRNAEITTNVSISPFTFLAVFLFHLYAHTYIYNEISRPHVYLIIFFPGMKHLTHGSWEPDRYFPLFSSLLLRSCFSRFLCLSQLIWIHSLI